MKLAILAITANGARLGARLRGALPEAELHVLRKYAPCVADAHRPFDGLAQRVAELWRQGQGLIFVMAAGIVVRTIAGHLQSKACDPAVVVLDEKGCFAVSLLSGHLGGGNALARQCAAVLGGQAVITTATDVNDLPSFDLLAQQEGLLIEDLAQVKGLNALLLDGAEIALIDDSGRLFPHLAGLPNVKRCDDLAAAEQSGSEGLVLVSNRQLPQPTGSRKRLLLHPKNLFLGIGCNRGTTAAEIDQVVARELQRLELSPKSLAAIGSATAKQDEQGLLAYAEGAGLPLFFYDSATLNGVTVPSPPSTVVQKAIGATGVAEPAALLAAGEGGRLLLPKIKSGNVTLAIAETPA
jgi:cobalt-precorrin 5A hydrolase